MARLSLPITSITEEYQTGKCQTVMILQFSSGIEICDNLPELQTYRKWKAEAAIDNAINSLEHRDIIGAVQVGRSRLGIGKFTSFCSSTNTQKWVIKEIK